MRPEEQDDPRLFRRLLSLWRNPRRLVKRRVKRPESVTRRSSTACLALFYIRRERLLSFKPSQRPSSHLHAGVQTDFSVREIFPRLFSRSTAGPAPTGDRRARKSDRRSIDARFLSLFAISPVSGRRR
jgi:hypothetical protein